MPLTVYPASPKQIALIKKLDTERVTPAAGSTPEEATVLERIMDVFGEKDVTMKEASDCISYLLKQPKKGAPAPSASAAALTEGVYICPDDSIVKVKSNKAKTGLYALAMMDITGKRLTLTGDVVKWDWVFAPGLIREIQPEWRMPAEVAHELGIKVGRCLWCGRKLKAAESVAKSLGPVCAKRFA